MEELLKEYPFRGVLSLRPLVDHVHKAIENAGEAYLCRRDDLWEMLDKAPELLEPIEDLSLLEKYGDIVKKLMSLVFPTVFWDSEPYGAVVPFSIKPFFASPRFQQLFLNEDGSLKGRVNLSDENLVRGRVIKAYLMILRKYYGIDQQVDYPLVRIVKDPETGLDRYFRINLDYTFQEAHALKKVRPLTQEERDLVLERITDPEILKEIIPPQDFELRGFSVVQAVDITESEVMSLLEADLIDQQSVISHGGFERLEERLRILFRRPKLIAGIGAIHQDQLLMLNKGCQMRRNCIFADSHHVPLSEYKGTLYERAMKSEEILRVPDILNVPSRKGTEEEIIQMGIRSMLIAPLYYKGEAIGILKLGCPEPGELGLADVLRMSQLQPLFSMALKRAMDDLDNNIQAVIKEKCTNIHPTVEWRFRKAAVHHLEDLRKGKASDIEPIVFKDVYPLYGVSDIRGSTEARNSAIQSDLSEHLGLALKVVQTAGEARPMPIFQEIAGRIKTRLGQIEAGLGTGDELSTFNFIRDEVEVIFDHLKSFGPKVLRAIDAYHGAVDPVFGTVYRRRKEFERSVSMLNDRLSTYLDQENAKMQAVYPHYFERHRTDGVDYLIYLGGSLHEDGFFNDLYLKNLRLWQIKVACGLAWHTEQLKASLEMPLDTAHLVLVQDTPLSVRFRFDEKRFDVEGAYDIRHEIIKSRLDKAVVKGARERLTQPGKIALVYSHSDEAREIHQHVEFLRSEGYLTGERETLELEDLPGVKGLRAMRVSVNLESQQAFAEEAQRMAG